MDVLHGTQVVDPHRWLEDGTSAEVKAWADAQDAVARELLHARTFAALVQASSEGGPVLLRIEKNSGHGGADMVRSWVELTADQLAFALAHAR